MILRTFTLLFLLLTPGLHAHASPIDLQACEQKFKNFHSDDAMDTEFNRQFYELFKVATFPFNAFLCDYQDKVTIWGYMGMDGIGKYNTPDDIGISSALFSYPESLSQILSWKEQLMYVKPKPDFFKISTSLPKIKTSVPLASWYVLAHEMGHALSQWVNVAPEIIRLGYQEKSLATIAELKSNNIDLCFYWCSVLYSVPTEKVDFLYSTIFNKYKWISTYAASNLSEAFAEYFAFLMFDRYYRLPWSYQLRTQNGLKFDLVKNFHSAENAPYIDVVQKAIQSYMQIRHQQEYHW